MGRRVRWSWIVAVLVGLAWLAPEDALAGRARFGFSIVVGSGAGAHHGFGAHRGFGHRFAFKHHGFHFVPRHHFGADHRFGFKHRALLHHHGFVFFGHDPGIVVIPREGIIVVR